jgi:hypothetical protein
MRNRPNNLTEAQQRKRHAMIDKLHLMWTDAFAMQGRFDYDEVMHSKLERFMSAIEAAQNAHRDLYRSNWEAV